MPDDYWVHDEGSPIGDLQKNSFAFTISRELAVAEGLVEPTEAELEAMRVRHAEFHAEQRAEWAAYDVSQAAYRSLTYRLEPVLRDVLELHEADGEQCAGCDWSGYDGEPPEWPCRTVRLIAARYDVEVMAKPSMPREWADGPLPEFRSPYPRRPIRDLFPSAFVSLSGLDFGPKPEEG
jgi:hypothetical protein